MVAHSHLAESKIRPSDFSTPMPDERARSTHFAWPALLLFASGFSALVFQVIWVRQLSLIVGVDVYAVTAGVSAFMAGLAIGGMLFGGIVDRSASPFRFYALLEAGVAICGIGVTIALSHYAGTFARLEDTSVFLAWATVFAFVGVPAILMGGTLPALIRSLAAANRDIGLKAVVSMRPILPEQLQVRSLPPSCSFRVLVFRELPTRPQHLACSQPSDRLVSAYHGGRPSIFHSSPSLNHFPAMSALRSLSTRSLAVWRLDMRLFGRSRSSSS